MSENKFRWKGSPPRTQFIKDCQYRYPLNERVTICSLASDTTGFTEGVVPQYCAMCQANSVEPNPEFMDKFINKLFLNHLQTVSLGFVKNPDDIEGIFASAYPFLSRTAGDRKTMQDTLVSIVERGIYDGQRAQAFVKASLPELLK